MKMRTGVWSGLLAVLVVMGSAEAGTYSEDLGAFFQTIDAEYPFLDLKGIRGDWEAAKPELMKRAEGCGSDEDFLLIVVDALKCLRDAHAGIQESRVPVPRLPREFYTGVTFMPATEGRVIVMTAAKTDLKIGEVVTRIDGQPAREFLEGCAKDAWKRGGFFSSPQRARLFEYRMPLRGERGARHTLEVEGREKAIELTCETEVSGWPHVYNMPSDLKSVAGDVAFGQLPSGVGYVYMRRVRGHETDQGLQEALKAYPDSKAWIVDLRGNGGGGYNESLIETVKGMPRPVAVIIDAGCISAGETLVRDFKMGADARIFGATSAGASSSKRTWAFPSGVASLTLPTRSRNGIDGKLIEFNGIEPDVAVEAVPEEVREGKNSEILRAEEYLLKLAGAGPN